MVVSSGAQYNITSQSKRIFFFKYIQNFSDGENADAYFVDLSTLFLSKSEGLKLVGKKLLVETSSRSRRHCQTSRIKKIYIWSLSKMSFLNPNLNDKLCQFKSEEHNEKSCPKMM